jgi:hypothetical protein
VGIHSQVTGDGHQGIGHSGVGISAIGCRLRSPGGWPPNGWRLNPGSRARHLSPEMSSSLRSSSPMPADTRARSLRLDDALLADARQQHAVVAVGGWEGAHEFADGSAVFQSYLVTQFGHQAGLHGLDRLERLV